LAATTAFELAARELIQVHGGIGMTWEHDCHLYYRRSRHLALILGDSGQWREILMARLMADSQSGGLT
jgi:acyl-CoA dehydrogenase